ncbi:MAG: hypothetical protein AABW67_03380 [Nanoarchaeota archaeon]
MVNACIGPDIDYKHVLESFEWERFHEKLISKDKRELGMVIGVLQDLINQERNPLSNKKSNLNLSKELSKNVSGFDIINHLKSYLRFKEEEFNFGDDYRRGKDRFQWNYANNILRSLKHIHQGTEFLLPYENIKTTLEFIDTLQRPHVDWFKTRYRNLS